VRLAWLGPELRDCEFAVEVRAEVVHYADGEENVHSELRQSLVRGNECEKDAMGERCRVAQVLWKNGERCEDCTHLEDFEIGARHLGRVRLGCIGLRRVL
jgi:hypothetical protein